MFNFEKTFSMAIFFLMAIFCKHLVNLSVIVTLKIGIKLSKCYIVINNGIDY